ncbi:MAG: hypothetical protein OXH60_04495 [Rhodospirillales bacterium]|nr:hypothetical protein [Rhodospirillales bacterium]
MSDVNSQASAVLQLGELRNLLESSRLHFGALQEGHVKVKYRALDPIWRNNTADSGGMIPLREHVKRMCTVANYLSHLGTANELQTIAESLHLAASLDDLFADTDLDGSSLYCRPAADFEEANSEVAAKYIASVIVFNFVWIAYEAAVEVASTRAENKKRLGKGARGRDILLRIMGDKCFPYLRESVIEAINLSASSAIEHNNDEMLRLFSVRATAAIAAEHLRCFRNAVTHGTVKPDPEDWGDESRYCADEDPALRQFHVNIRITLILIQLIIRNQLDPNDEIAVWQFSPELYEFHLHDEPDALLLTQLHCELPEQDMQELPLGSSNSVSD